jgi:hypothetical protein
MKSIKYSLITALALGSSAQALDLENVKLSGQATLYYNTIDKDPDDDYDLFHKQNSKANVGLSFKMEAELGNDFGFGARLNVLETMGLEGSVVTGVMQNTANVADEDGVGSDEWYFGEVYLTKTIGQTFIKVGRQELNTPFAFTEKWNVMPTTFEAAVIINKDVQDVTLIGAYVDKSNTHGTLGNFNKFAGGAAVEGVFMLAGAYGSDNVKAGGYFYHVPRIANALWADVNYNMGNVKLTGQVAHFMLDEDISKADDTTAFAGQVTYIPTEGTKIFLAAGANTGEADSHTISNLGTGAKTKLVTATITGDGDVAGASDTTAVKLKLVQKAGPGKLIAQAATYIHGEDSSVGGKFVDETGTSAELIYKAKVGGVNLATMFLYADKIKGWTNGDDASQTFRVIARYNF